MAREAMRGGRTETAWQAYANSMQACLHAACCDGALTDDSIGALSDAMQLLIG